jgi:hypothetical protein
MKIARRVRNRRFSWQICSLVRKHLNGRLLPQFPCVDQSDFSITVLSIEISTTHLHCMKNVSSILRSMLTNNIQNTWG